MFWVIAYDISANRRRRRIAKILEGNAFRVQGSVFEGTFTVNSLLELIDRIKNEMHPKRDSVRFYPLCSDCDDKIKIAGYGRKLKESGFLIL